MKVYIAGPMTGLEDFNYPAFKKAAWQVGIAGHDPTNPHTLNEAVNFDAFDYPTGDPAAAARDGFDIRAAARRDLLALTECDAIYLLPGWENSAGARAEKAVADWLGLAEFKMDGEGAK